MTVEKMGSSEAYDKDAVSGRCIMNYLELHKFHLELALQTIDTWKREYQMSNTAFMTDEKPVTPENVEDVEKEQEVEDVDEVSSDEDDDDDIDDEDEDDEDEDLDEEEDNEDDSQ